MVRPSILAESQQLIDFIAELDEETLIADGFEDALIGYTDNVEGLVAIYDRGRCLEILMQRDGMTEEEAVEFFEFNVAGAYVGPKTPIFATILRSVQDGTQSGHSRL